MSTRSYRDAVLRVMRPAARPLFNLRRGARRLWRRPHLADVTPSEPERAAPSPPLPPPDAPPDAPLAEQLAPLRWYHSIDFGNGVVSRGIKPLAQLRREADVVFALGVARKSVLDIGAWDGFFSLEAHRRGASRVVAVDSYCWTGPGWGTKQGFELMRRHLAPAIEDVEADVMDLRPEHVGGPLDVVLFLGVLYHLRHPLLALERLAALAGECLVVETYVENALPRKLPAMAFYPGRELMGDPTNWWAPNVACVAAMLREIGFRKVYHSAHPTLPYTRGIFHALR